MLLDPKAQAILDAAKNSGKAPVYTLPIEEARKIMYNNFVNPNRVLEEIDSIEDSSIPCIWGDMPIRIYRPNKKENNECFLFFHGGGFSINCIETHEAICRKLAKETNRTVISVEYRLAPEHKYPAGVEDAISAAQWVYDNAKLLNINRDKIAIGGDSGGAHYAIVTCLYFKNRNGIKLEKQILVYPPTDYFLPGTPSLRENDQYSVVNRDFTIWAWMNLIDSTTNLNDQYLCPLRAKDCSGLPPALVITAEGDPLRDEGELYAKKMEKDGTKVKLSRYKGMMHGFFMQLQVFQQANDAVKEIAEFLAE